MNDPSATRNPTDTFAVAIAGGGLVGGCLAIALAQAGLSVGLVEAVPPAAPEQPSFDDRTIALSRSSCAILRALGLWPLLEDQVWPIEQIHVSEAGRFGTAVVDAGEQGVEQLGYVIQGRALGLALWQRIGELSAIQVFCPARVAATDLNASADHRTVQIDVDGSLRSLNCQLLAVADGARSATRSMLGIEADERDYQQLAIVCNLQVDARHAGNRAYERFHPDGPLALLPGADGCYTLVLARRSDIAHSVLAMSDEEFLALVQDLFGYRLGRLTRPGKRQAYPLALVQTRALTASRAALVGNAAHGLHPVAGQGFNLGLRDVASLAEVLVDAARLEGDAFDAGDAALLNAYRDWRKADQAKVVKFTDGLINVFALSGELAGVSRAMALSAFDMLPGVKREFARHTMGLAGRQTRLARGLDL